MSAAAKKPSFLDAFWTPDSKPGKTVPAAKETPPASQPTPATPPAGAAGVAVSYGTLGTSAVVPQIDDGIKADLLKTMTEAHPAGYTYLEFMEALKNMEAIVPSESDRFKAVYAAVKSMIKPADLVKTAQIYVDALQKNLSDFNSYLDSETKKRVTTREENAKKSDAVIEATRAQIDSLTQQISKLQADRITLLNEAAAEKAKVDKLSANFKVTWDAVTQGITADIKKIQTYLGV